MLDPLSPNLLLIRTFAAPHGLFPPASLTHNLLRRPPCVFAQRSSQALSCAFRRSSSPSAGAAVVAAAPRPAESIGVGALLGARPDPFCGMEACWLQHLEEAHREVVDRLASRLPLALRRGRVRPLGLDRYGVRLRVEKDDGDHDVRLPFAQPVDDVPSLSRAIRVLMGCPFLNGLRARRV